MDVEEDLISSYRTTLDSFSSVFSLFLDFTQEAWQNESANISYSSIVQKKKAVKPSEIYSSAWSSVNWLL